ncbi:reverse transcriptase domain-containing protein [Tanacetum coccineum]
MEKLVLALVSASKRVKRYFQAHTFIVITYQTIKEMLLNPEVTGRLLKKSFELEEHDIQYRPRISVKGKILADFMVERPEDNLEDTLIDDAKELPDPWTLFIDGSSCADGFGAGLILTNPEGMEFTYAVRCRNENKKADALSKIASTSFAHLSKQVLVKELKEKSISAAEVLAVVEDEGDTWMTPIFKYLMDGTLPVEGKKARAVKRKSWRFGLPGEIILDNGKQFQDNPFKDWCEKLCIRQHFASVKHPQTNGLVERANRSLGEGIKARLDERIKNWMEELPHVLWAHHTMIKSSNGDTPFSLTYGT